MCIRDRNGYVSRGVCEVDDNHQLLSITERTHIEKREDHAEFTEDDGATWASLPFDTLVSVSYTHLDVYKRQV